MYTADSLNSYFQIYQSTRDQKANFLPSRRISLALVLHLFQFIFFFSFYLISCQAADSIPRFKAVVWTRLGKQRSYAPSACRSSLNSPQTESHTLQLSYKQKTSMQRKDECSIIISHISSIHSIFTLWSLCFKRHTESIARNKWLQ